MMSCNRIMIIREVLEMEIVGVNNYSNNCSVYSNQIKNDGTKEKNTDKQVQKDVEKNIQNQDVSDYYSYLQKNYDSMKNGNVTIAGEYLKQCASDSMKAKELEDFLKKIPELEEQGYKELSARNKALGGTVTYYQQTWTINKDGSVQSTVYSVTETEMTNAERMKKNMDERLEKQKEKKSEEKKKEEKKKEDKKAEEKANENRTEEGLEVLKTNKMYQSMKVNYIEASSAEELEEMVRNEKSNKQTLIDM